MKTKTILTKIGSIPQVESKLNWEDYFGAMKVRWLIGRNNYTISSGLYALGFPNEKSEVFVTANYKLSFDHLRKNLRNHNAWILVLDTKGVNVWCAAGKGTFGTAELVNKINLTGLRQLISHRRLIVPQLGATGISAHKVKQLTSVNSDCADCNSNDKGFHVMFGPVRANDLNEFIQSGFKANNLMRRVTFPLWERVKLTPVDIVYAGKKLIAAFVVIFILAGINKHGFNFSQAINVSWPAIQFISLAYIAGIVFTPIVLPYIPVRMFAFKGWITGVLLSLALYFMGAFNQGLSSLLIWFLLLPAVSSFMAMNFTGGSTFTSLSGVKREMKIFVPIQVAMASVGLILFVIDNLN